MGRPRAVLGPIAVCLGLAAGCSSMDGRNLLGWNVGGSKATVGNAVNSAEESPFRNPNRPDDDVSTARSGAAGESSPPGGDVAGPESLESLAGHDPELQRLIEQEAQHMPPEERKQFLNDLQGLDPPMIRRLLRVSRMARQMRNDGQNEPRGASKPGSETLAGFEQPSDRQSEESPIGGHSAIETVGGVDSPPPERDDASKRPESGLGGANPWDGPPSQGSVQKPRQSHASAFVRKNGIQDGRSDRSAGGSSAGRGPNAPARTSGDPGANAETGDRPRAVIDEVRVSPPDENGSMVAELSESLKLNPVPDSAEQPTSPESGPKPASRETALQDLIARLADEVAGMSPGPTEEETQEYIEKQVALRALYLMEGQQERALEAIPGIAAADQEFWQQVFWAVANYFDEEAIPDSADRATQTIEQLRAAVQRLQEKANLELRNVTFCHKITSFGNYEQFEQDEFSPGQPVLVYAEVRNFASELTSDGRYRTALKSTIEIYKAGPDGGLVERVPFPSTEDHCRNYRRDYFHSYEFTIPQQITLGPHVLKLTVEDQLSQKVATYSLNFMVE